MAPSPWPLWFCVKTLGREETMLTDWGAEMALLRVTTIGRSVFTARPKGSMALIWPRSDHEDRRRHAGDGDRGSAEFGGPGERVGEQQAGVGEIGAEDGDQSPRRDWPLVAGGAHDATHGDLRGIFARRLDGESHRDELESGSRRSGKLT